MRRFAPILLLALACAAPARAHGLLIPTDKQVPPLALVSHEVDATIEDQVAVTRVTQVFRNTTDRPLEATYIFPVPKGASVRKFAMWVDGKEVAGELVEAEKARTIYTDIVRRTQDPGLLEYMGGNLLKLRVFPVPARGDQKLSLSYTSVANSDNGMVEYVYPLKGDGKNAGDLEKFAVDVTIKSQHPIQNVYSPTHPIRVTPSGDHQSRVHFDGKQVAADKDFQLYYTAGTGDVGLTTLLHRPERGEDGHFLMLISPRAELSQERRVPRDVVFVLDTSGSMNGARIRQAKSALKFCLRSLDENDRFGVIHFASTVNNYTTDLVPAASEQLSKAQRWVDGLEAVGGTNIDAALAAALEMRPQGCEGKGRTFTVVFFTDGQPTIGETSPENILKNVTTKNNDSTRIFTFGVGDDVNAVLLDSLADRTRSVSTYVRENEDIEAKVSSFYGKISHPVLTNLKLTVGAGVTLSEVYPPQLPDLFHGSQLVVAGRYHGKGHAQVKLTGNVGNEAKEFDYEVRFPVRMKEDKAFVEDLWARRKVGYLLDQIRTSGVQKELVDEVVRLAKRHGIATPYTSYLVVPDNTPVASARPTVPGALVLPVAPQLPASTGFFVQTQIPSTPPVSGNALSEEATLNAFRGFVDMDGPISGGPRDSFQNNGYATNGAGGFAGAGAGGQRIQFAPVTVSPQMQWAVPNNALAGAPTSSPSPGMYGGGYSSPQPVQALGTFSNGSQTGSAQTPTATTTAGSGVNAPPPSKFISGLTPAGTLTPDLQSATAAGVPARDGDEVEEEEEETSKLPNTALQAQAGKAGVDLSVALSELRNQSRVGRASVRQAFGRKCVKVRGVWVDDGFDGKMKTVIIKAQSEAYFRMLERHARMQEVFQLGNRVVWVTPSGTALVIDTGSGQESMDDADMDRLFVTSK